MAAIGITYTEWFPVHIIRELEGAPSEIDLTDEELEEARRIFREFGDLQRKIVGKLGLEPSFFLEDCEGF